MSDEKIAVNPTDETTVTEVAAPEAEQPEVTPIDAPESQEEVAEGAQEKSPEVDVSQQIEELKNTVNRLQDFIRRGHEEKESTPRDISVEVPKDPRDFLTKFAENPQDIIEKVIQKTIAPQQNVLLDIQRNQAVDYIRSQKDYTDKMLDEILFIVEGQDRNRWFQVGNTSYQLKDLPPRQKAEAALQIYREKSNVVKQQQQQQQPRPKPVTTVKTQKQPTAKKADKEMSAEEFLKFHGLDKRIEGL
jgi:hypothetical protein